jgi:phosphoglucosamine mutase
MGRYFGTDGIRGTVGEWPLVPEFFLKLGKATGRVLGAADRKVAMVVGRDTRGSGAMLQNALVAGLLASGVDVVDVGVIPTAGVAWLLRKLDLQAGAVISASHNPVEQNGIKFIDAAGLKFSEALETEIEDLLQPEKEDQPSLSMKNQAQQKDGRALPEIYLQALLAEHPDRFLEGLTLLLDCSNGAASDFAPQVFKRAGARVIALHASPDGSNINDQCGSEFVRRAPWEMGRLIEIFQADFGLAFDGDADRVVFVDENGRLIDGDHILGFLSRYLSQKGQLLADTVVTTTMRNTGLKLYLEAAGLKVIETPVGDKYVVDKLLELRRSLDEPGKYGLGGEQAGHIDILSDLFTTGDGIRTALFVLRAYLDSQAGSLSSFAAGVGKTPQIIASAYVGQGERYARDQLQEMENSLLSDHSGLYRVSLRYSGTEPLLRVMLESDGRQDEERLADIAWRICRDAQFYAGVTGGMIDILNCTNGGVITRSTSDGGK